MFFYYYSNLMFLSISSVSKFTMETIASTRNKKFDWDLIVIGG